MSLLKKAIVPSPTLAEWPVRIWEPEDFPRSFVDEVLEWMQGSFKKYDFVYAPLRYLVKGSFAYLFGYGYDEILFLKETAQGVSKEVIQREQVIKVQTNRELSNAEFIITYQERGNEKTLSLPYVASVYYLFDPFLNWILGQRKDFSPMSKEMDFPRPQALYQESLAAYNYSLGAYRLGGGFEDYSYTAKPRHIKWMPWKKELEEWLEVPMERGIFRLHLWQYQLECTYLLSKKEENV